MSLKYDPSLVLLLAVASAELKNQNFRLQSPSGVLAGPHAAYKVALSAVVQLFVLLPSAS